MRTQNRALVLALLALFQLAGASAGPHPLAAQGNDERSIFLALPNAYPDVDGRVVLLREPGREIVVVAESATPEDLTIAFRMLERFRREHGQPPAGRGHMIPIVGYAPDPVLGADERARLEGLLVDLKGRPFANVGNLGPGRWMRYTER